MSAHAEAKHHLGEEKFNELIKYTGDRGIGDTIGSFEFYLIVLESSRYEAVEVIARKILDHEIRQIARRLKAKAQEKNDGNTEENVSGGVSEDN